MKNGKNLEEIADFVRKEAESQPHDRQIANDIKEVRKLLEEFSNRDEKNYTFTVGEMNAYLG